MDTANALNRHHCPPLIPDDANKDLVLPAYQAARPGVRAIASVGSQAKKDRGPSWSVTVLMPATMDHARNGTIKIRA
jgi:hypothetical protein